MPIDAVGCPPYGPPPLSALPASGKPDRERACKRLREVWPCSPIAQPGGFQPASTRPV